MAIGVAGWSYPDWKGYVYEGRVKDPLRYLAGFVDLIEINNTFYRMPEARMAEDWARRTADLPAFFFSAKLHQDMTHEGRFRREAARAFSEGFRPLREAGKLRHLLAQFRYDFRDEPGNRDLLRQIAEAFAGQAVLVLELRHGSWQSPEALGFIGGLGVALAHLDYPAGPEGFALDVCPVGEDAYLRLHGRNRVAWYDRNAGRDETYNYDYSRKELEEIRDRALRLARRFRSTTIVANNHYHGKEVANALQLMALLGRKAVKAPEVLRRRYPNLAQVSVAAAGDSETKEQWLF